MTVYERDKCNQNVFCCIYCSAPEAREQGYSFTLFAGHRDIGAGLDFIKHLGMLEEILKFSFQSDKFCIMEGLTGNCYDRAVHDFGREDFDGF